MSAQASVSVSAAAIPTVTAGSSDLRTFGHPFTALPFDGGLLVSMAANGNADSATGLRVYTGGSSDAFAFRCLQPVAFSTRSLKRSPDNALLGYADTGGVARGPGPFRPRPFLAIANSNRLAAPAQTGSPTILQAVSVDPVLLRTVPASHLPRNITEGSV